MARENFEMRITMKDPETVQTVYQIVMEIAEDEIEDELEINFKNAKLVDGEIVLNSNPIWDRCENGACFEIAMEIASQHPNYSFELESSFEGAGDMLFDEYAKVENAEFHYTLTRDYGDGEKETKKINKVYDGQKWIKPTKKPKKTTKKASSKPIYVVNVTNEGAIIKEYNGTEIDIIVPDFIEGYKVVAIGDLAFSPDRMGVSSKIATARKNIKSVALPEGVVSIGDGAFAFCKNLECIVIPEGVVSIGDDAFAFCENLKSIVIPESVTSIGSTAFYNCENLVIHAPKGSFAEQFVENPPEFAIEDGMLKIYMGKDVSVVIPDGVVSIGFGAFAGCAHIETVSIPESVNNIYLAAFSECTGLKNINIPNSVTQIGVSVFEGCANLKTIIVPSSVTIIEDSAFCDCINLTCVTIPESVTSIAKSAFDGCNNLAIHAPTGSFAEQYAKENNITFVSV
ncbi:MAG: leucine-rich repeat domain-containing protein [Clostridia bacterium]|nr:leucine-rich repeat domain-containing protein [Clostridia bacterium]